VGEVHEFPNYRDAPSRRISVPNRDTRYILKIKQGLSDRGFGIHVSHGEGQPFAHVLTVHDTVENLVLTPGADVRIRVKASKAAGQSAFSIIAEVTVPAALAAAA